MCRFYSRRVGLHSPRSESALHHALTRMHFRRCRCFYRVSAESTLWERRRLDVRNRIRDYDGNGAMDGERGILTGASLVKLPVRACHLFRECFAVYLSGASSLTLFFGAYITPHISSNLIGFLCGLIFVMGIALILYEIHLRIPLLKFLFSGKPPVKQESRAAIG